MRRQHTGRDAAQVLGPHWADAHRAAAEGTHTAACTIRHPGVNPGATFDRATGSYTQAAKAAHYTGPCMVDVSTAAATPDAAEETVPTIEVLVAIAIGSAPATDVGDLVTITSPGPHADQSLAGVVLQVESIDRSSLAWERILRCSENQS